ncbi:MAG: 2,3-bisphosphoglycerate-dependent phosphoglycerate mutase, partial [Candidatus Thermoplasmatota archaeon]|nr:2,3-bisphosphoglycerate-dependent phosphoglycerate mutase [Candidatus Thermoplasmatota archaeon]
MNPGKLVLVRHGLSTYNDQNRFTGWKDVPLNAQGIAEAEQAVLLLSGMEFGIAFTSVLVRAQHTLDILLAGIGQEELPVERDLALNERNYGDLIGQNKAEAAEKFGAEQVHKWRRSYDLAPPGGESLKDT